MFLKETISNKKKVNRQSSQIFSRSTKMLKKIIPLSQRLLLTSQVSTSAKRFAGGIYEPDYLNALKPTFPQHESLNFQMKGYDFAVLENYQKFLHNVAEYLELDVSDCYALPPKRASVQRLKPNSTVLDSEYKLTTYERNLQINYLDAPMYPQFLRIAQAALPEGVTLKVEDHTSDHDELRYVPDKDLIELKSQLEYMQKDLPPSKKK